MDDSEQPMFVESTSLNLQICSYDASTIEGNNYNFEKFLTLFHVPYIDISCYWLINIGFNSLGEKKFVYLIIRAYAIKPFYGPHLVSLFTYSENSQKQEMITTWVHSLTFLRKEIFLFQDRLSFERSTFLIPAKEVAHYIRIKSIRGLLTMPHRSIQEESTPTNSLNEVAKSPRKQRSQLKMNELINGQVQNLVTFINRETNKDMRDSILQLRDYINDYCNELVKLF